MNEILDVVNEKDEVTGKADYKECHEKGLMHRTSCVFVFKDKSFGEILLFKRNPKFVEPNKLCIVGGHVESGENYFETAKKELHEEVFFQHELSHELELHEIGKIFYNDMPGNYEFDMIYWAVCPGPFFPNPEETKNDPEFYKIEDMIAETKRSPDKFTVAFLRQFDKLVNYLGRWSNLV